MSRAKEAAIFKDDVNDLEDAGERVVRLKGCHKRSANRPFASNANPPAPRGNFDALRILHCIPEQPLRLIG